MREQAIATIGFLLKRTAKRGYAMILKVARLGFPSLRTAASPVPVAQIKTKEFQQLIDDMIETMYEYNGVGLAAPQVHLPIQLAVLEVHNHPRYPEMPDVPLTVLVNPVVTILDKSFVEDWEGCLSVPELRGRVPRFKQLRVKALDRNADPIEIIASDFHARVIQHETDQLKGEVYLDRMPDLRALGFLQEWQRYMVKPEGEK